MAFFISIGGANFYMKKPKQYLRQKLISILLIVVLIASMVPPSSINAASNTKPAFTQKYQYSYAGFSNTYTIGNVKKGYTVKWTISKALKDYVSFSNSEFVYSKTVKVTDTTSKIKVYTFKSAKAKINAKYTVTAIIYDNKGKKVSTCSDEVKINIDATNISIINHPENNRMSVNTSYNFDSKLIPSNSVNKTFWIVKDDKNKIIVNTKSQTKSDKAEMNANGVFKPKAAGTYKIFAVVYRSDKDTVLRAKSKAVEIQVIDPSVPTVTPAITVTPIPTAKPTSIIVPPPNSTYTLTIVAGDGGTITAGTSGNYSSGTTVSLAAAPREGYIFAGWTSSNGGSFGNASLANTTFVMPGSNTTITANFIINSGSVYTRGQWIQLLADKLNFDYSSVDMNEFAYKYADTQTSGYGLAIEMAEVYGILPPPDSEGYIDPEQDIPFFRPNETATREFAAFTAVKAMGFMGEYPISCSDLSSLKYPNEDAVAILQGFLSLSDNKFNPNTALSVMDKNSIFTAIDIINASTIVDVSNPHENVTLAEGVIRDSLSDITDYTIVFNADGTILLTLPKNDATGAISVGKVFILPSNKDFISGIALKAISITDTGDNKLAIVCSEPDITEVLTNLEYEGIGTADISNIVTPEDVLCEYDPNGSIEDVEGETYSLDIKAGGSVSIPGKLTFTVADKKITDSVTASGKVSIEIPAITCKVDASIGLLSGVNLNELLISIKEKIKLTGEIEYTAYESGYQLTDTRWIPGKVELGRLPIALGTTGLSIDIVFFYNVNVKGSAEITYTVVATQGIQVRNGSTRLIHDFSDSLDFIALKGSAKAGLGMALRLNAFRLMDLIGIDGEAGLGISASFTPHVTEVATIYCADGTVYCYMTLELDTDTAFGMFIKTVWNAEWSWDIWDEDNSPFKLKLHVENGSIVDECTFGVGGISGYVHEAGSDRAIPLARVILYSGSSPVKTIYSDYNGNFIMPSLNAGDYTLKVSATGYQTYTSRVTVIKDQSTYVETLLMIDRSNNGLTGNVSGNITDAVTGGSVSDVTYNVRNNWNNTSGTVINTGITQNGTYSIELAAGNYTIEFTKSEYVTTSINIAVLANASLLKHVALSPVTSGSIGGDVRIVLTWGATPSDLDSHLYGPTVNGSSTFHTWYSVQDYAADGKTIANLDLDDTSSYGPETTTVYELNSTGVYSFYVHDYSNGGSSNSTALSSSGAQVRVYSGNQLVATYNVPLGVGGTLWHVFDYDVATDTLTAVNTFSYSDVPGSVRPDARTLMAERSMVQAVSTEKSELLSLLETMKEINKDQLPADVVKIITAAEAIANDSNATQESVDEIVQTLKKVIEKNITNDVPEKNITNDVPDTLSMITMPKFPTSRTA